MISFLRSWQTDIFLRNNNQRLQIDIISQIMAQTEIKKKDNVQTTNRFLQIFFLKNNLKP